MSCPPEGKHQALQDTPVPTALDPEEILILADATKRHSALAAAHRSGNSDAERLRLMLLADGEQCIVKKFDMTFHVTDIRYGYDGYITARGYRLLQSGKWSKFKRDIGPITVNNFTVRQHE
jgi:hypothetical protein